MSDYPTGPHDHPWMLSRTTSTLHLFNRIWDDELIAECGARLRTTSTPVDDWRQCGLCLKVEARIRTNDAFDALERARENDRPLIPEAPFD